MATDSSLDCREIRICMYLHAYFHARPELYLCAVPPFYVSDFPCQSPINLSALIIISVSYGRADGLIKATREEKLTSKERKTETEVRED